MGALTLVTIGGFSVQQKGWIDDRIAALAAIPELIHAVLIDYCGAGKLIKKKLMLPTISMVAESRIRVRLKFFLRGFPRSIHWLVLP